MQTLEQKRAEFALKCVQSVDKNEVPVGIGDKERQKFKSEYRSYVDRLLPSIVMNGLGQALATELAAASGKEQNAHYLIYSHLQDWLVKQRKIWSESNDSSDDLLENIIKNGEHYYLRAQLEALAWLEWLKKFANAYLPKEDTKSSRE